MPYGPIPAIKGLPAELNHEQKKALTAAAANYGCPLLYLDNSGPRPPAEFQDRLMFGAKELQARYEALRPRQPISLIVIGCPQASVGEIKAVAEQLRGQQVSQIPLWVFTSSQNKAIAEKTGLADIIRQSGAVLLENTCPEVVPYDPSWVSHILTNSMKAEHEPLDIDAGPLARAGRLVDRGRQHVVSGDADLFEELVTAGRRGSEQQPSEPVDTPGHVSPRMKNAGARCVLRRKRF